MENLEIKKLDKILMNNPDLKRSLEKKAQAVSNESEFDSFLENEIMSIIKENSIDLTKKDLLNYEKEGLKELDLDVLSQISGGFSLKPFLMSGGILSVVMLGASFGGIQASAALTKTDVNEASNRIITAIEKDTETKVSEKTTPTKETSQSLIAKNDKKETNAKEKTSETTPSKKENTKKENQTRESTGTFSSIKNSENTSPKDDKKEATNHESKNSNFDISISNEDTQKVKETKTKDVQAKEETQKESKKDQKIETTEKNAQQKTPAKELQKDITQTANSTKEISKLEFKDKKYVAEALNLIDPFINNLTGVTENFRFLDGSKESLGYDKNKNQWRFTEDKGEGSGNFMASLFPSPTGVLTTDVNNTNLTNFTKNCNPDPQKIAGIISFFHNNVRNSKNSQEIDEINGNINFILDAVKGYNGKDITSENFKNIISSKLSKQKKEQKISS